MRMVRWVLVWVVSLCVVGKMAMAQEIKSTDGPVPRCKVAFDRWEHRLEAVNLSDEQKAKWEKLKEEYAPKILDCYEETQNIITPEQKKARNEAAFKAFKAGKRGTPAFRKAIEEAMKLTEEQKVKLAEGHKKLDSLREEFQEKVMDILTPEQREQLPEPPHRGSRRPPK